MRVGDSVLFDVDKSTIRVMDSLPDQTLCEEHTRALVTALMDNHLLMADRQFMTRDKYRSKKPTQANPLHSRPAFAIRKHKGKAYLTRVRCACHTRQGH